MSGAGWQVLAGKKRRLQEAWSEASKYNAMINFAPEYCTYQLSCFGHESHTCRLKTLVHAYGPNSHTWLKIIRAVFASVIFEDFGRLQKFWDVSSLGILGSVLLSLVSRHSQNKNLTTITQKKVADIDHGWLRVIQNTNYTVHLHCQMSCHVLWIQSLFERPG